MRIHRRRAGVYRGRCQFHATVPSLSGGLLDSRERTAATSHGGHAEFLPSGAGEGSLVPRDASCFPSAGGRLGGVWSFYGAISVL